MNTVVVTVDSDDAAHTTACVYAIKSLAIG
jgi:hypothetical protein